MSSSAVPVPQAHDPVVPDEGHAQQAQVAAAGQHLHPERLLAGGIAGDLGEQGQGSDTLFKKILFRLESFVTETGLDGENKGDKKLSSSSPWCEHSAPLSNLFNANQSSSTHERMTEFAT